MPRRLGAILAITATLAAAIVMAARTGAALPASHAPPLDGKGLYRKYCGQCHALRVALAAGFGSGKGLGINGGPSFDNLRVPYSLAVLAVKQPFIGHEVLVHKMTWQQIRTVAGFVAKVTRDHPIPAQNIDG
jgi:hypothetical protein